MAGEDRKGEGAAGLAIRRVESADAACEAMARERRASFNVDDARHVLSVANRVHKSGGGGAADLLRQPLPTFQRSDFQVGGMVGQGSFATVHKAKQIATGRSVVLKVVRPESELDFGTGPNGSTPAVCYRDVLRAMKKEVNLMDSLGHNSHVVQVLGTAEDCRV
eukprot:CAMPEP_0174935398 /NCGR_PEP_ID=MMETSP1355-20121228/53648_1 /TAXON_ID=464990 /ORGANISM="Hemiselmis tepida, Strain CCMP443" /LENGTH=163 /DNA_ID=CAMNT_0016182085 /DNA_START=105 /DNA_END=593 /DNA_ORIENTATION=+